MRGLGLQMRGLQEQLSAGEALLEVWLEAQDRHSTLAALFSAPSMRQVRRSALPCRRLRTDRGRGAMGVAKKEQSASPSAAAAR